jgi:diguanylate cyclase (GGDEF)-like protein
MAGFQPETRCLRSDDVLCRIGGDEFLAICPGLSLREAQALRERIQIAVSRAATWRDQQIELGITIGFAVANAGENITVDDLVAAADQDMYSRKPSSAPDLHGARRGRH